YDTPMLLRLVKGFKRDLCAADCRNMFVKDCIYEINVIGTTLYTNFTDGTIYMQYYGIDMDGDDIIIPDTPKGHLNTYMELYLKSRIVENILFNGDDVNLVGVYRQLKQDAEIEFRRASADAKYMTLTPDSYRKLA